MSRMVICVGPPGCGKNTWVQQEIQKSKHPAISVCLDDFRAMICGGDIHNYKFNKKLEELIVNMQEAAIIEAAKNGYSVYVADTNLNPKTVQRLTRLAKSENMFVETHNFFEAYLKEFSDQTQPIELAVNKFKKRCKEWNLKRNKSVPESVIDQFFEKYIVPNYSSIKKYVPNESKPKAILVDLDGTLFHMNDRGPFDYNKVDTDTIDIYVKETIKLYKDAGYKIILASGRDDSCFDLSAKALAENEIEYDQFFMRPTSDQRSDWVVKEEIFYNKIATDYNVCLALDDRDQVVSRYRAMGIKVYQVQPGNF